MSLLRREVILQTASEIYDAQPADEYEIAEILERNVGNYLDTVAGIEGDIYEV